MVKKKEKAVFTVGKRKTAIARANVIPGTGKITIDSKPLEFWGNRILTLWLKEPLILAGDLAKKVDIDITVNSGGIVGQAEAIRMAISRGLIEFYNDKELKNKYMEYNRSLLVYDPRRNEPHHGSGRGASKRGSRRHKQRSKR
jgi:small subunit ribosomal protein S9